MSLFALEYRNEVLNMIQKYQKFFLENFITSLGILTVCHIIGSLLLIPGTMFLVPGGLMFGDYFNGEFYGYIISIVVIIHINILAGFIAFLNSKMCLKSRIR